MNSLQTHSLFNFKAKKLVGVFWWKLQSGIKSHTLKEYFTGCFFFYGGGKKRFIKYLKTILFTLQSLFSLPTNNVNTVHCGHTVFASQRILVISS